MDGGSHPWAAVSGEDLEELFGSRDGERCESFFRRTLQSLPIQLRLEFLSIQVWGEVELDLCGVSLLH